MAILYVLSGTAVAFSSLWAPRLNIDPNTAFAQAVTILGLVSIIPLRVIAGIVANPQLDAHKVPARDRNAYHSVWMAFWILGLALGGLPLLMS